MPRRMLACQASPFINMIKLPEFPLLCWRRQGRSREGPHGRRSDYAHTGTPGRGCVGAPAGPGVAGAGASILQEAGVPAGHGDREPRLSGDRGPEGKPAASETGVSLPARDGHPAQALSLVQALGRAQVGHRAGKRPSPIVQMRKPRHTSSHPCLRPSQSKEVVTLGQKLKTNGVRPRVRNLYPELPPER